MASDQRNTGMLRTIVVKLRMKVGLFRCFCMILLSAGFVGFYNVAVTETHQGFEKIQFLGYRFDRHDPSTTNKSFGKMEQDTIMGYITGSNHSKNYDKTEAKIVFHKQMKLFNDISSQPYVNYTQITTDLQKFPNASIRMGQITLEYSSFRQTIPRFITEIDRKIFLMSKDNRDVLSIPVTKAQLTGDIGMIYMGRIDSRLDCGWRNNLTDYQWTSSIQNSDRIMHADQFEILVPLVVPNGGSFQHFMDGVMPKIAQIAPFLTNPATKVMVEYPLDNIILEMFEEMGLNSSRVMYYSGPVVLQGYQINTCITPPLHPALWGKMRDLLGVNKHLQVPMKEASVILLTREWSRNGGRKILNKGEVISHLQARYKDTFILFHGGYNLAQSKAMFGKARLVLGIHGGAFYNINFCPEETVIAEYFPLDEEQPTIGGLALQIVWAMAEMNSQRYYMLTEHHGYQDNLNMTINKLESLLDVIDGIQLGGVQ